MNSTEKQKIAVLGGGVSAMTSLCYLTESPNWQEKFDITVYQLGWRIGGKGASGRNAEYGQRVEEHGLHIWFGAYVNSFKTIEKVYDDLARPKEMPLATWQEAFKPQNFVVLQEYIDKQWKTWPNEFPYIPGNPANSTLDLTVWEFLKAAYFYLKDFIRELKAMKGHVSSTLDNHVQQGVANTAWYQKLAEHVEMDAHAIQDKFSQDILLSLEFIEKILPENHQVMVSNAEKHESIIQYLLKVLRAWLKHEFEDLLNTHDEVRRLFICADLGLTIFIGLLQDKVHSRGFAYLNQWDYREWLTLQGANVEFTVNSAVVRGFYDLAFAYPEGDFNNPNIEAGVSVLAMLRMAVCYRGGFMWEMQAGMGDTLFSPIYQLLKRRGVKFEFFHQVDELIPKNDSIDEIRITQQVALADESHEYDPLVMVKDLPCWPSQPKYSEIDAEQAKLLKKHNINLESFWTDWPEIYQQHFNKPLPKKSLKKGIDFDLVIFGISVGSIPHLCPQLLAQDSKLKRMVDKIGTVATQAYQLWIDKTESEMGWTYLPENGQKPVLSGFVEPFDTWAAMDQLLCREDWPTGINPKNASYFCNAYPQAEYPPKTEHDFPKKCKEKVKQNAINQLKNDIFNLWPDVAQPGEFNWDILTDPKNQIGEKRFDSQYWRCNVDPSERYVLSVKGSSAYRLKTDETIFDNLYLTGDWLSTGVNAGCVEAATMAGMQTSRAICGNPAKIDGETGFLPKG
ncbi:NAD(P)-binding protein [Catenovulum sediminis]|uniref:NAD(P)-binding protein n=1 Tax=Catenovulum sediminis TaxID=1740262 RepID=UPI001180F144|nr:NAD(P)-binding protein [Catenovulum sediminis]